MLCHMWGSNELAFTDSKGVGGPPLSKDLGEERAEPELWSKTGGWCVDRDRRTVSCLLMDLLCGPGEADHLSSL